MTLLLISPCRRRACPRLERSRPLFLGLTVLLAGCVIPRAVPVHETRSVLEPPRKETPEPPPPVPSAAPLPPLETLYAQYPAHLLGIGEECHTNATLRRVAAEQSARYHLARSIRVTVASEVTWWKTSLLLDQKGTERFRDLYCKTYQEAVDEWLGQTDFRVLSEYHNTQGTPCLQLLAVVALSQWQATAGIIPRSAPITPEALERRVRAQVPLTRTRALALALQVTENQVFQKPDQLCLEDEP